MSNEIILDASAVLALLNEEPGHQQVENSLEKAVISAVNLAEVITVLVNTGLTIEEATDITTSIIAHVIPFDQTQAVFSASLRKLTKQYGLSLGDRACIALGKMRNVPIVTADKAWGKLNIDGVKIQVIR